MKLCGFWLFVALARAGPDAASSLPPNEDARVWPWMGEAFLDGFLEKDAVRLSAYLGALRDIGCEELTDLLLVEARDLDEMGMSESEISRFERGVAEIRRWQDHQDEYAMRWGSLNGGVGTDAGQRVGGGGQRGSNGAEAGAAARKTSGRQGARMASSYPPEWRETPVLQPETSAPELDGWGIVAGDREALRSPLHWRQRPVAALLGFMDQSQQMITESGKLDLKSMRAIQAMKSLSSSLSDTIQNLDQNFGIDLATMKVDGILRLKDNPSELQRFIEQNAERIAGEIDAGAEVLTTPPRSRSSITRRTGRPGPKPRPAPTPTSLPPRTATRQGAMPASSSPRTGASTWASTSTLIEHVRTSIRKATIGVSKLSGAALAVDGMSSSKVRHLLNNLCSLQGTSYLEIGSYKGSTLVAALVGNEGTLARASAVDDFSQFGGPRQAFWENVDAHIDSKLRHSSRFLFVEDDAFTDETLEELGKPLRGAQDNADEIRADEIRKDWEEEQQYNVYMYDGGHTAEDHRRAFTQIGPLLAPMFVVVIDDWNQEQAKGGTREAFAELSWTVVYETELPSRGNGDEELWWNGLAVAIVKK